MRRFPAADALLGRKHALVVSADGNVTLYGLDEAGVRSTLVATGFVVSAPCQALSRASDDPRTWVLQECY